MDLTEVSIAAYEAFAAVGYADAKWWSAEGWRWAQAHPAGAGAAVRASGRTGDHPVVAVTFHEADAYCRWKGQRLPTGAEWEAAACNGGRYPWGDDENPAAVWYQEGHHGQVESVKTKPVTESPLPSHAGLLHAAGNVWEWTQDAFDPVGKWRTLRGGSYANLPSYCTCAHKEPAGPDDVRLTVGFRCTSS